jgi:hypothetical protein
MRGCLAAKFGPARDKSMIVSPDGLSHSCVRSMQERAGGVKLLPNRQTRPVNVISAGAISESKAIFPEIPSCSSLDVFDDKRVRSSPRDTRSIGCRSNNDYH